MKCAIGVLVFCGAALLGQQHSYSPEDVETGARLYQTNCLACHGQDGDAIADANLRRGEFRRGSSDDDLMQVISYGIPGTAMPPHNFVTSQLFAVVAFLRSLRDAPKSASTAGTAERGRILFEGKGGCPGCHRVDGKGARIGPDLSDVGLFRSAQRLERSILEPNESILLQHRLLRAVTADGTVITGRRLNEDTHTVQLLDAKDRLISLIKADLKEYGPVKTSPMPSFRDKFTAKELADLVSYLVSLKGSPKL
jgi:putative heme-binding domain-containing protein